MNNYCVESEQASMLICLTNIYLLESRVQEHFLAKKTFVEDDICKFIIEDQHLENFIPAGTKPARKVRFYFALAGKKFSRIKNY